MAKQNKKFPLEIVDTAGLTDAEWAEINRLKAAYAQGGDKALSKALDVLSRDPILTMAVLGAFFPDDVRNAVKDQMAEQGIDEDDLREILRKAESRAWKH